MFKANRILTIFGYAVISFSVLMGVLLIYALFWLKGLVEISVSNIALWGPDPIPAQVLFFLPAIFLVIGLMFLADGKGRKKLGSVFFYLQIVLIGVMFALFLQPHFPFNWMAWSLLGIGTLLLMGSIASFKFNPD